MIGAGRCCARGFAVTVSTAVAMHIHRTSDLVYDITAASADSIVARRYRFMYFVSPPAASRRDMGPSAA